MSKKHTGLMLYQVRGPLNNLLDNLSGENGAYWLEVLKKLLRKEEPPKMPANVLAFTKALNSKKIASEKIEEWAKLLNSIPSVHNVHICDDDALLDIEVSPNIAHFLHNDEHEDTALFVLEIKGSIKHLDGAGEVTDTTFDKWVKDSYKDIYTFYEALLELCEMYQNAVPSVVK